MVSNIPGIYTDDQIAGWKKVTDAVHKKRGFVYIQLGAIGRVASEAVLRKSNFDVVSAGNIPISEGRTIPRPLTKEEIHQYVEWYAKAAKNAVHGAGFDGIEIHNANGYLLDQFIQTNSNNRTDEFGGSAENRSRFSLMVLKAVTEAIGQEKTAIRFSPYSSAQGMRMPTDLLKEQFTHTISSIRDQYPHLAYLHLIEPRVGSADPAITDRDPGDANLDWARTAWGGERYGSPLFCAGGYSRASALETVDKFGGAIVFGRLFLANPDLPLRLRYNVKLNGYKRSTFYTHGSEGYTDYPFSSELSHQDFIHYDVHELLSVST
ncbi:hypothetical protein FRB95_003553 [Tulasnella sp. JGI-2019a]|nr:hypothetical protein FRB95_003553 [Tulasnella sp. JGI-2019a]